MFLKEHADLLSKGHRKVLLRSIEKHHVAVAVGAEPSECVTLVILRFIVRD